MSASRPGNCQNWQSARISSAPRELLPSHASAVSDAPRSTPEVYLSLTRGRVRYSCLKEAASGEALMQIRWGCGDEKDLGNG
jgi:hypothetical protein